MRRESIRLFLLIRGRGTRDLSLYTHPHTHTHTHTQSRMEGDGEREKQTEKRPCEDTVRRCFLPDRSTGTSLVAQWLRLHLLTQGVWGSIRG